MLVASRLALDGEARFLLARGEASLFDPWLLRQRRRGLVTVYFERRHDRAELRLPAQAGRAAGVTLPGAPRLPARHAHLVLTQDNIYVHQDFDVPRGRATRSSHRLAADACRHVLDAPARSSASSATPATTCSTRPAAPYVNFTGEIAGGPLQGTSSFTKLVGAVAWYRTVKRGWVLAARVRAGAIDPFGTPPAFTPDTLDRPRGRARAARGPLPDRRRQLDPRLQRERCCRPSGGLDGDPWRTSSCACRSSGRSGSRSFVDSGNVWARPSSHQGLSDFRPEIVRRPLRPEDDVRYVAGAGCAAQPAVRPAAARRELERPVREAIGRDRQLPAAVRDRPDLLTAPQMTRFRGQTREIGAAGPRHARTRSRTSIVERRSARSLAEEIADEIEEVVEHVPQPVRWTVRKLVALDHDLVRRRWSCSP